MTLITHETIMRERMWRFFILASWAGTMEALMDLVRLPPNIFKGDTNYSGLKVNEEIFKEKFRRPK